MSLAGTLRDLTPPPQSVIAADIETAPMEVTTYSLRSKYIPWKNVQKPTRIMSIAAKEIGTKHTVYSSLWDHGEENLIQTAWEIINQADVLVTWNGNTFDQPLINREALVYGLPTPSPTKKMDLMRAVKSKFRFDSYALGFVSQQLGLGSKLDIGSVPDLLTPSLLGDEVARGQFKAYNIQDVHLTEQVYNYLYFRGWLPSVGHKVMDGGLRCTQCASEDLDECGTHNTSNRTYVLYRCTNCMSFIRGSLPIGSAQGIAVR